MSRVSAKENDARLHHKNSLQHYLRQMDRKAPSYALSQGECQVAFQHWVAFVRGRDCSYTSDVTAKEHLRCPLLWCRESFDNLTSTLQHVSACPWLSNAWYWCPYCCRPESFIGSEEPCVNPSQCKIQRKDSKLRRAVTFFKHLGHKSCSRKRISGSSAADPTEDLDTWFNTLLANQQESEMEDTSHKHSGRAEVADSSSTFRAHQSYIERRVGNVYEMEDASIDTSHAPNYLSRYTPEANSVSQPCELDTEPFITEPRPRAELASPEIPFTAIGAQFEGNLRDAEPTEEMLVSPASTFGSPVNYESAEPITSRHSELESPSPAYKGTNTVSVPGGVDHHACHDNPTWLLGEPPVTSGNGDELRDAMILSTQSQVEDLCKTVGILNQEWLQRCQPTSDLFLRASSLSPQSLLDKGAQALQLIFQGRLPCTFDAMFAMVHFACAAAYTMNRDDSSHRWNEFFQHILPLQNLIESENDARQFAQLINLLFRPQCSSAQCSCGNISPNEGSGTLVPLRRSVFGLDGLSSTETINSRAPRYAKKPSLVTLLHSLMSSAVFQECSRFLDGKLILNIGSTNHDLSL